MRTNSLSKIARIVAVTAILIGGLKSAQAQQFIDKAVIEFEVKTNVKKTMGSNSWAEMLKEALPQFKTGYYTYTFSGNKSLYRFDHWDAGAKVPDFMRKNDEDNIWYMDHDANKFYMKKNVFGSDFLSQDSIPVINWKISNESRVIAGFNCRKAVGKISDSVYVFAFYTDEILISGGPCSINGLPGMILGLTIPRMYTSWIATHVIVNGVKTEDIKPFTAKKYLTMTTLKATIKDRTKDWVQSDDPDSQKWMEQLLWNIVL